MKKIILLAVSLVFFSISFSYAYPLDSPEDVKDDVIYRWADEEEAPKISEPKVGALEQILQAVGKIPVQVIKLWRSE